MLSLDATKCRRDKAMTHDIKHDVDENGHVETIIPHCHYCGRILFGMTQNGMHAECDEKFQEEWDEHELLVLQES